MFLTEALFSLYLTINILKQFVWPLVLNCENAPHKYFKPKISCISEKPVSPKSGTLKSPPKGFDTSAINKSYYNVVSDSFPSL